ncbi:MAG: hypothetical protein GOU97_00340 [Nanoarchaeota archaeon]|nr:hypothetical protein [Nanoarchaeota archaeon]
MASVDKTISEIKTGFRKRVEKEKKEKAALKKKLELSESERKKLSARVLKLAKNLAELKRAVKSLESQSKKNALTRKSVKNNYQTILNSQKRFNEIEKEFEKKIVLLNKSLNGKAEKSELRFYERKLEENDGAMIKVINDNKSGALHNLDLLKNQILNELGQRIGGLSSEFRNELLKMNQDLQETRMNMRETRDSAERMINELRMLKEYKKEDENQEKTLLKLIKELSK